jgi:hypothetical protein
LTGDGSCSKTIMWLLLLLQVVDRRWKLFHAP